MDASKPPTHISPTAESDESSDADDPPGAEGEILPPAALQRLQDLGFDTSDPERLRALVGVVSMSVHHGPIPPADMLEAYENAAPGTAAKIIEWADEQMGHRHQLEEQQTRGDEKRMDRAQRYTLTLAIVGLIIAGVTSVWGNAWVAAVIAIVAVGGPNTATVLSRLIDRLR